MSFDSDPDAKLNSYGGQIIENKSGLVGTGLHRSMMVRRLMEQLAANLADGAVVTTEDAYTVQHKLQVYVLTPTQLERYVQRRAERLHKTLPDVRWVE